jgi:hypothetical protein
MTAAHGGTTDKMRIEIIYKKFEWIIFGDWDK